MFIAFKDQEIWYNWNRNDVTTACTQGNDDIFHEAYVPSTPDDVFIFKEKQTYVYSVFKNTPNQPSKENFTLTSS